MISHQREPDLAVRDFIDILTRSGLAARRPVDDGPRMAAMLARADIVLTARDGAGRLVGLARCLSDDAYVCYVSELAVCRSVQGQGVGTGLLRELRAMIRPEARVFLLSAPAAVPFYEKIGLPRLPDCFDIPASFADKETAAP